MRLIGIDGDYVNNWKAARQNMVCEVDADEGKISYQN